MLEVVDCRQTKQYGVQYKAMYIGNWDEWNAAPLWQPWTDFEGSGDKTHEFHSSHPQKPQPLSELAAVDNSLDNIQAILASSI